MDRTRRLGNEPKSSLTNIAPYKASVRSACSTERADWLSDLIASRIERSRGPDWRYGDCRLEGVVEIVCARLMKGQIGVPAEEDGMWKAKSGWRLPWNWTRCPPSPAMVLAALRGRSIIGVPARMATDTKAGDVDLPRMIMGCRPRRDLAALARSARWPA